MYPLHEKAVKYAENWQSYERKLFATLIKIADTHLIARMGYSSMPEYLQAGLKLTECKAEYFRRVLFKALVFPKLKDAVVSGALSISQARRICGVMDEATEGFWIESAMKLKQKQLERLVAERHPRARVKEGIRPIDGEHSEGVSKELCNRR